MPTDDYADARIPGHERCTWRVVGTAPAAPIAAEHFHLNLVRCEPGQAALQHNHLTVALSCRLAEAPAAAGVRPPVASSGCHSTARPAWPDSELGA